MTRSTEAKEPEIWFVDDDACESRSAPSADELNQFAAYFNRIRKARVRKQLILLIEEILADQDRKPTSDADSITAKSG